MPPKKLQTFSQGPPPSSPPRSHHYGTRYASRNASNTWASIVVDGEQNDRLRSPQPSVQDTNHTDRNPQPPNETSPVVESTHPQDDHSVPASDNHQHHDIPLTQPSLNPSEYSSSSSSTGLHLGNDSDYNFHLPKRNHQDQHNNDDISYSSTSSKSRYHALSSDVKYLQTDITDLKSSVTEILKHLQNSTNCNNFDSCKTPTPEPTSIASHRVSRDIHHKPSVPSYHLHHSTPHTSHVTPSTKIDQKSLYNSKHNELPKHKNLPAYSTSTSPTPSPTSSHHHSSTLPSTTNAPPATTHPSIPSSSVFGSNEFVLAMNDTVKYSEMSNHLKDKILSDDSATSLEFFYEQIIIAVFAVFKVPITTIPTFEQLDKTIDFHRIFHDGLIPTSSNYSKVNRVYQHLGTILKGYLLHKNTICESNAPKAYFAVQLRQRHDGWSILRHLLMTRLIRCGSSQVQDLTKQLVALTFDNGESYHSFFKRCHGLNEEYRLRYGDPRFIPTIKILDTFITNLARAQEYAHHISSYQDLLLTHYKTYNDMDYQAPLPFLLQDVYDRLSELRVPHTPRFLLEINDDTNNNDFIPPSTSSSANDNHIIASFINSLSLQTENDDDSTDINFDDAVSNECNHPVMCALARTSRNPKQLCPACLLGFHQANDCFARGSNFLPKPLHQRINVYNKQHGDKPPSTHVIQDYKPKSPQAPINATRSTLKNSSSKKQVSFPPNPSTNPSKPTRKAFNNYVSKVTTNNASINFLGHEDNEDTGDNEDIQSSPTMNAFIQSQEDFAQTVEPEDTDCDIDAVCCSLQRPSSTHQQLWSFIRQLPPSSSSPLTTIDFSQAFDRVQHNDHILLSDILSSNDNEHIINNIPNHNQQLLSTLLLEYECELVMRNIFNNVTINGSPMIEYIVARHCPTNCFFNATSTSTLLQRASSIYNRAHHHIPPILPTIHHPSTNSISSSTSSINSYPPSSLPSLETLSVIQDFDLNSVGTLSTTPSFESFEHQDPQPFPMVQLLDEDTASISSNNSSVPVVIYGYPYDNNPSIHALSSHRHHHRQSPSAKSFNIDSSVFPTIPIRAYTPSSLLKIIMSVHQQNHQRPHRHFLRQHSNAISSLPSSTFSAHCNINAQTDGGANVHAVIDDKLLYFTIDQPCQVEQVGGTHISSPRWGGMLVRIKGRIYSLFPVYHCPSNPRNTFSPQGFLDYGNFQSVKVDTHKSVDLIDHEGKTSSLPLTVANDLDYVTLEIMRFTNQPCFDQHDPIPIINAATSLAHNNDGTITLPPTANDSTSINIIQQQHPLSSFHPSKSTLIFPIEVMARIAEYYISYFDDFAPQQIAISIMNEAMGNKFLPRPQMNEPPLSSSAESSYGPTIASIINSIDLTHLASPSINAKLTRYSRPNYSYLQQLQRLHLGTSHLSNQLLFDMIKAGTLLDLPPKSSLKELHRFNCHCWICNLTKPTRLPRGNLIDKSNQPPFFRTCWDFQFFNVTSIRGFTSALTVVCESTSYPFAIPCRSRAPPADIFRYVIRTIRSLGYAPIFIRVDRDGALAQSAEFCMVVTSENCILETTGGGNSSNNGMAEVQNRADATLVRSGLMTLLLMIRHVKPAELDIRKFWCCILMLVNEVKRKVINRMRGDSPFFLVHGRRPSAKELVIPGSIMTIINPSSKVPKLSPDKVKQGYFLCYGNNVRMINYWDPQNPYSIQHCYHAIIEDVQTIDQLSGTFNVTYNPETIELNSSSSPSINATTSPVQCLVHPTTLQSNLLQPTAQQMYDELSNETTASTLLQSSLLDTSSFGFHPTGFPGKNIYSIKLILPPLPTPVGFIIQDDHQYNLPFIRSTTRNSVAYNNIPSSLRNNQFILAINGDCPLTSHGALSILQTIQSSSTRVATIDIVHRGSSDSKTSLSASRALFDSFPAYLASKPIINSLQPPSSAINTRKRIQVPETHEHFVTSPRKPTPPKSIFEALKSPFRRNWKAAAWIQFKKNKKIAVFSLPFPKSQLPSGARVFNTLLVPEIKATEIFHVWECRIRECVIGTPQQQYIDFDNAYAPVASATTIRTQIAWSAANGYFVVVLDIKNAFQNTIAKDENRIFVSTPPLYLEWLTHEEGLSFDPNETYLRVMLNANQGTKDAGNQWYHLLSKVFREYNLHKSTVDHGFFSKGYENSDVMLLSLATDDCLCSFRYESHLKEFVSFITQYFDVVVQNGQVLKFLGIRIVQSNHAISIDQGEYIFDALETYFGENISSINTVSTPFNYSQDYNRELASSPPLDDIALRDYALEHNGSYRHHTGVLNWAATTRPDIKYGTQRLSEYNHHPNSVAFAGIKRMMRYLAGDPLRPLVYPRVSLSSTSTLSYSINNLEKASLSIPHWPIMFNDAELAGCLLTRSTYYCNCIFVNGVAVSLTIKKTQAGHTTDSETKAQYEGLKGLQFVRKLFDSFGTPCPEPSLGYCDNKATVDIIESGKMTGRSRHNDIPIAFLHAYHNDIFRVVQIPGDRMPADIGTKANTPADHKKYKYWITGERFLPPPSHEHYKLLQMEYYEKPFSTIYKMLRESS